VAFAPNALERIGKLMAPNIIGMEPLKRSVTMQLFAKEPVHVLLLGDPGTGKTDILRSVNALAPKSSLGLGSGTSGAGLSAMAKGDELVLGLLPMADGGIACIDELNLMKPKDMASLYNAMEKGFITYDKGSKHEQLPAHVRVVATANPVGDTFIGKSAEILKKQIPFEDALLSRFHLIFLVRKPNAKEFEQIASHIIKHDAKKAISKEDSQFVKEYIDHAMQTDVVLDPRIEAEILLVIKQLKGDERHFITEVGPRTVVGIVRIVKAVARAELATSVEKRHVETAFGLLRAALYVRREEP
jgi:DNA replicative helicase MCM subunit Mcm2 (Cdc46/Mcm family)